jgi:hypothetical protein|nr:hypothetical protein ABT39_MTgene106 [Picea glauca]
MIPKILHLHPQLNPHLHLQYPHHLQQLPSNPCPDQKWELRFSHNPFSYPFPVYAAYGFAASIPITIPRRVKVDGFSGKEKARE